jgi:hypothetical protein
MKYSCSLSKRRAGRDPRSCGAGLNPKRPRTGDNSPKENTWARHRVISRKEPTSTAKLRMTLSTYRAIQSTRTPSLPHLYACAQPAFRTLFTPTDEFDAPSVRKDTQPENTRVQPPQGVPTFQPREYRAFSSRFSCALELGSKWGGPKAVVGQGS